ncbi:uncharacterized protein ACJ7VT_015473 [Polymixia lowei]
MPAFNLPTPLLCVLVCVSACARALQRSDLRLAYVTHRGLYYCSCAGDPHPCGLLSPAECSCKDVPLSALHRPRSHASLPNHVSSPLVRAKHLTVWYTSPPNAARLLNNSEVRHLTLVRCSPGGPRVAAPPSASSASREGYFAVQHLERLTVVCLPWRSAPDKDGDRKADWNADPEETESGAQRDADRHADKNRGNRDTNAASDADADVNSASSRAHASAPSSPRIQDIFLGRELGAAYQEQARLGLIHTSVLEGGAPVKAYTVQTHIDSSGALPFPNLYISKLPETSSIYVTFIY